MTGVNPVNPPQVGEHVFGPGQLQTQVVGSPEAIVAGTNLIPFAPAATVNVPPVSEVRYTEAPRLEVVQSPGRLEWGQFSNEPDYPIVFNVPRALSDG